MPQSSSCCVVPSELAHKILTHVLANSVHAICVAPEEPHWELGAVQTLASVSATFHDITVEVAAKAFVIPRELSPAEIIALSREKLAYLRALGVQTREPFGISIPTASVPAEDDHLVQAYSMYAIALALRRHAIGISDNLFRSTYAAVFKTMFIISRTCSHVLPKEMAVVLTSAVEIETFLVRTGLTIFDAQVALQDSLDRLSKPSEYNDQTGNETRRVVHEALQTIENALKGYHEYLALEPLRVDTETHQTLEFKHLLEIANKYANLEPGIYEFDIATRATAVVDSLGTLPSK